MFQDPTPLTHIPGAWFPAEFSGECSKGGHEIVQGDMIRRDGHGEYECEECVTVIYGEE